MNKPREVNFSKRWVQNCALHWLRDIRHDRKTIGEILNSTVLAGLGHAVVRKLDKDLWKFVFIWTVAMPECWFTRSNGKIVVARFIKKSQATKPDLTLAKDRMRMNNKAKKYRSSFWWLLAESHAGRATAVAVKRVSRGKWPGNESAKSYKKSMEEMQIAAQRLIELLDTTDTSLTLTTLSSAASVLGKKLRIELETV